MTVTPKPAVAAPSMPSPGQTPRKAALASFLGSTLEYYDFFIYGSAAALVFSRLFFPTGNPTIAMVASFATFGVAYIARPIGGLVMSHFGDKLGRKKVLLFTLSLMGLASLAIGLLPTYAQVGVWAPILLTICRLAQGFSAGAESAGASTLTLEHSPEGRRGFFTSFVMTGYAAGMVLATLVFIPIASLPEDQLLSWGWRIPFLLSAVVLVIAYWVRTHLAETPVFEAAQQRNEVNTIPVVEAIKYQLPDILRVLGMSLMMVMQTVFSVFGLAYATGTVGLDRTSILTVNAVAIGLSMLVMPVAARLSDKVGRRPLMLTAVIGCSLSIVMYFWALSGGNMALIFVAAFFNMSLFYSCYNGVWPACFAEQFAAPIRYSGMALGNQLGLVVAGFAPMIAGLLLLEGPNGWVPVAVFAVICSLLAGVCMVFSRETAHTPVNELGGPYLDRRARAAESAESGVH